jgi:integrase
VLIFALDKRNRKTPVHTVRELLRSMQKHRHSVVCFVVSELIDIHASPLEFLRGIAAEGTPPRLGRDCLASSIASEWEGPSLEAALLEYIGVRRLKPRTALDYQVCLRRYWADYMEQPLASLDANAVLARFRTIQSPAQANYSLRIIRAVFRFHNAAHDDTLPIPTAKVLALEGAHPIAPRSRLIPDDKQPAWYRAIQSNTGPVAGDLFIFLACTGLRLGEALSLKWEDIDLAGRSLTVKDTKNGKPHSLPLGRRIIALLEGRHGLSVDASSVVFHINQRNVRKAVARVISACPVPWSSHDLRRGLVSLAVRLNIPDRAVKRLVNHSESDVTGRHYVHLGTDALRPYVQSIEDALWKMWETGD